MGRRWTSLWLKLLFVALTLFVIDQLGIIVHFFEYEFESYYEVINLTNYGDNTAPPSNNYYDFAYLQKAVNKCGEPLHLVVLVKSAIDNVERREVIRRTWGYEPRFSDVNYRCIFVVGSSEDASKMEAIESESTKHKDIVQGDFIDAYFNNTIKTMTGIRWSKEYCPVSDYYMFVDDDYYVSIKNILKFIAYPDLYPNQRSGLWSKRQHDMDTILNGERLFAGYAMQTTPLRHKFSKWYISIEEYPFDKWPPYITAGAFVLSNDALYDIYSAGKYTPVFRFDDIYLAMVAINADIKLTHCNRFHFYPLPYKGPSSYQHVLAAHGFDDSKYMEKVWNECRSAGYA